MELKTVRLEHEPGEAVATLWLDRPDRLNAWTGRMHTELRWVMDQLNTDDHTRVVVITGEGRGFCAGADSLALQTHLDRGSYDAGTPVDVVNPAYGVQSELAADFAWVLALHIVTIAAINGPAAGVGLVLACYCDLRFVANDAKLTTSHGKLNLPAEYGMSWLLPRLIGLTHANDLLLSSRVVLGVEAASMGLANQSVPTAGVLDVTRAYADAVVATVSPASLATSKRQVVVDQLHEDPAKSVRHAQELLDVMVTQDDYREAIRIFGTGSPADWSQPPTATKAP